MSKEKIFLVADDHSLIRQGIIFVIEDQEAHAKIIQASTLRETLQMIKKYPVDFIIMDAHFPDGNSINHISEIKQEHPNVKILIFSGVEEEVHALKFINQGADGFLSKMSEEEEISRAIDSLVNSGKYLSPMTQELLLLSLQNPKKANPLAQLSEREMQIAKLYANGYGNLEIANELDIKQNTVSTIKKRLFEKLKIENIVQLIELMDKYNYL